MTTTVGEQEDQPVECEEPRAFSPEELEQLVARAEERDRLFERMQRMQSEMENIGKRARRERDEWLLQANQTLIAEVLPVLDSLELALQNAGEGGASLREGVENVARQLRGVLERHGVRRIEAEGLPFDPAVHEALMTQQSAEHPDHTVLAVLKQGYRLHDRVLRPAQVSVSKRPAGAPAGEEE